MKKNVSYGIYIILLLILIACGTNCHAQSRFNKIINLNREANHILVSLTPRNFGFVITCGTDNYEMYGYNRCSLIAILNDSGECINTAFVGDNDVDTYEGRCNQEAILTNQS